MPGSSKEGGLGFRDLHIFNLAMLSIRGDGCWTPRILFVLKAAKLGTTKTVQSWRQRRRLAFLTHGEVFSKALHSSRKE